MAKGCSLLVIGFLLLISIPICIAVGGGIFGLLVGLIGGAIGLVFGLIGAVIGGIAAIFKGIFYLLFGWHYHAFHPWHFNGFFFLALIVLIVALATRSKK